METGRIVFAGALALSVWAVVPFWIRDQQKQSIPAKSAPMVPLSGDETWKVDSIGTSTFLLGAAGKWTCHVERPYRLEREFYVCECSTDCQAKTAYVGKGLAHGLRDMK